MTTVSLMHLDLRCRCHLHVFIADVINDSHMSIGHQLCKAHTCRKTDVFIVGGSYLFYSAVARNDSIAVSAWCDCPFAINCAADVSSLCVCVSNLCSDSIVHLCLSSHPYIRPFGTICFPTDC